MVKLQKGSKTKQKQCFGYRWAIRRLRTWLVTKPDIATLAMYFKSINIAIGRR